MNREEQKFTEGFVEQMKRWKRELDPDPEDKMLENLWNDYEQQEKGAIDNVMKNFQNEYEQKIKDGFVVTGTTTMTGIEDDGTVTASMWIEFERRDKTEREEEA